MLILNMILRITGFTQENLANYLDVSRASVNSWLSDDSTMSNTSKSNIADKFGFPVMYFDYDLNQNIELYKLIYSTISNYWNKNKEGFSTLDKINDIINDIEYSNINLNDYTDAEILDGLINGYNPFTGEVYDSNHILNNQRVKSVLQKLKSKGKFGVKNITKYDLNKEERKLFEALRKWRLDKKIEENFFSAYMVFTDNELINIIKADINKVEDLANIKGIGSIKYNKYADELYRIIKNYKINLENIVCVF